MYLLRSLLLFFSLSLCCPSLVQATPKNYTDYIPKYRTEQTNILLAKISYTDRKMMIHFQYIASEAEVTIELSGMGRAEPWKLHTPDRSRSGRLIKLGTITDVMINGRLEARNVKNDDALLLNLKKGDLVTGVVHFDRLPGGVQAIHFTAGSLFACKDLMIKNHDHPLLGDKTQMKNSIARFHNSLNDQGVTLAPDPAAPAPTPQPEELAEAKAPIDYTPKQLRSSADLSCNTRVNLRNVYFNDNSAKYAGRIEALETIQIIIDYMNYYPESKIILHGHTDVQGNPIRNFELSKDRVFAVRNTLMTAGIQPDRIYCVAHGDTQPLPGKSRGNKRNRRVEVEIICADVKQ